MFAAGAVCPHPPLLVHDARVVPTLDHEVELLRSACHAAVERVLDTDPARVVVVGDAARQATFGVGAVADFTPYGIDLHLTLGQGGRTDGPHLPLSLAVGAWLLKTAGFAADVTAIGIPSSVTSEDAAALSRALVGTPDRVIVLAMGDGSAKRSPSAPGYVDGRAAGFDEAVSKALATADTEALLALDESLAQRLMCAGRASWQVLAGAATGHSLHADLLYDDAPYGVGYFVATWTR